jgi:hypothetical protein
VDHSEERIKRNISFRYRNELKIRSKKRIGFMHVDITKPGFKSGSPSLNRRVKTAG